MNQEKIEHWLVDKIASSLGVDSEEIDLKASIFTYGLDSSVALSITGDLETFLDFELDLTLFWEYPKISELAEYLADETAKR